MGRGDQVARALGADPVVAVPVLAQLLEPIWQVGELVHNQVGPGSRNYLQQLLAVVDVAHRGLSSQLAQAFGLVRRARHPHHLVTGRHQEGDETQPNHPAGPSQEDAHLERGLILAVDVAHRPAHLAQSAAVP